MADFIGNGRGRGRADVIVVGAGPVGLTLALGLARHGLAVRVVDREPATKEEPRAAVIWPRGAEALDDLGAAAPVAAAANALQRLDLHSRGCRVGAVPLGGLASAYPVPLIIEQHHTERLLTETLAAAGVAVERSTEAVRLQHDEAEVSLRLRRADGREEEARASWVVGCDGSRSFVRQALGIDFPGRRRRNLQILQVDAEPRWRHPYDPNGGHYFIAPDACLGVFPRPEGGYRFFAYVPDPDPGVSDPPTAREMRELIAAVAGTPELELEQVTWLNRARFQQRLATRLRHGRVLIAGDAAHVWPSIGGHGMNIGLRGAHNLAWKLAAVHRGEAPSSLLDTYDAEERHAVSSFLRLMRLNLVEYPTNRFGYAPRAALLKAGLAVPGLAAAIERAVSDLDAGHGRSPLSRQAAKAGRLRAGDRAPDEIVVVEARRERLHGLLDYTRWTWLRPAGLSPDTEAALAAALGASSQRVRAFVVEAGEGALAEIARRGLQVLIRPDRHIGLVARADDAASLAFYLRTWASPALDGTLAPERARS